MIDLHIHTTYSDGADSLIEVLKKAEQNKLEYISITDHDNCNGYMEMKKIDVKEYYTGKIIPGIEIKLEAKITGITFAEFSLIGIKLCAALPNADVDLFAY